MKEKRILMLASTQSHILQFHLPYCKALEEKGYVLDLALPSSAQEGELRSALGAKWRGELFPLSLKKSLISFRNLRVLREILDILQKKDYDILISHTSLASFWARLALCFSKSSPRTIVVVHGYLFHPCGKKALNILLLFAEKLVAGNTDLLLTMNAWDYEKALAHNLGKQVALIPGMGVPAVRLGESPTVPSSFWSKFPSDSQFLAYGGEFSKRKNQKFLLEVLSHLPEQVHLLLGGEGALKTTVEQEAQKASLSHRVHFCGQVSPLSSLYQRADIVLSSSVSEGLPFHLMEAMALGKPILASDIKGHQDLLSSDSLFSWDSLLCAHKIMEWLERPTLRSQRGEENRQKFQACYSLDKVLPQVLSWYVEGDSSK